MGETSRTTRESGLRSADQSRGVGIELDPAWRLVSSRVRSFSGKVEEKEGLTCRRLIKIRSVHTMYFILCTEYFHLLRNDRADLSQSDGSFYKLGFMCAYPVRRTELKV